MTEEEKLKEEKLKEEKLKEEKLILEGVRRLVDQFAKEFLEQPYRYWQEIDVQVALTSRIDALLRSLGLDLVRGNYPRALTGFQGNQLWSRVSCEPSIWMEWKGKWSRCNPDIVIWKHLEDENDPPDQLGEKWRGNWPMLWACEIKLDDVKKTGWDEKKLVQLLKSGELDFGCIVDISRKPGAKPEEETKEEGKLQVLKFALPSLPSKKLKATNDET
ncbi:hypothetical protein JRI60_00225 [Archangium violaceum]|uniref:hypothetical protein n=1 Tax=Archangium violaceum TaxID=83451 RepID=UPI00194DEFD0|nr:hypothetical protein [Archangium violaceum]QRN97557.1 hypothetical protein JRI60_00225 [Archangium violaceum]